MPRPSDKNWAAVDWSLPNKAVAAQKGCSGNLVSTMRRYHAPETIGQRAICRDWAAVDWHLPTREIAARLGCSLMLVSTMRRKHAPKTVRRRLKSKDWAAVDWSLPNREIATRLGRSAQQVSTMRRKYAPKTVRKRQRQRISKPVDWAAVDWDRPTRAIAESLGRAPNTVSKMRKKHAPHTCGKHLSTDYRFTAAGKKRQLATAAKNGRQNQPKATAAAQRSEAAGRGERNIHAKRWRLRSPDGKTYEFANLHEFIRRHPALFAAADREWRRTGGRRGTGGEYCRASAGIQNLRAGKSKQWKGWTYQDPPESPTA